MEYLKNDIYELYDETIRLNLEQYNNLINKCVQFNEMAAVVYLYDRMKNQGIKPTEYTFTLINKLHSKTCKESNIIYIKNQNVNKLAPRRRIHKIMKGYNYSDNYNNALKHLDKVKNVLNLKPNIKTYGRIKLAKTLEKECGITFNEARYIITNLKRTKFLNNTTNNSLNIVPVNHIKSNYTNNTLKQTSIKSYFGPKL